MAASWDHNIAMSATRAYRAGDSLEDVCRACKTDRAHTVVVVDGDARPIRVVCDYCRSEHNYRGGPRIEPSGGRSASPPVRDPRPRSREAPADREGILDRGRQTSTGSSGPVATRPGGSGHAQPEPEASPIVSDRERIASTMSVQNVPSADLELLLRRIIREESGLTSVTPAEKWRGGTLVLRPGTPGLQEKTWPIETFFHKIVMLRNRLRTLEQQVNASDLSDDVKVKLQSYVTGCYGSLTSFNVLFADEDDHFKGTGGE
jgi:hypothetical protein